MKEKQLIERSLKFSDKYIYNELVRGSIESAQCTTCDNCGKLITNMVKVTRQSDGKKLTIGTDCADTIFKAGSMLEMRSGNSYQVDIYAYNLAAKVITEIKKGAEVSTDLIMSGVIKENGKIIRCYTSDLKKYFPEYVK